MANKSPGDVIECSNLTTTPMSIFFTLTFPNVLWQTCVKCQLHFYEFWLFQSSNWRFY